MSAQVIPFPTREVEQYGPVLDLELARERQVARTMALEFIKAGQPGRAEYTMVRSVLRQAKWVNVDADIPACRVHGLRPVPGCTCGGAS